MQFAEHIKVHWCAEPTTKTAVGKGCEFFCGYWLAEHGVLNKRGAHEFPVDSKFERGVDDTTSCELVRVV